MTFYILCCMILNVNTLTVQLYGIFYYYNIVYFMKKDRRSINELCEAKEIQDLKVDI